MAMRAGSYNAAKPKWQGLIRDSGWPLYECYHWGDQAHDGPASARKCAQEAVNHIRATGQLPEGWSLTEEARKVNDERKARKEG